MLTAEERETVITAIALYLRDKDNPRAAITDVVRDEEFSTTLEYGTTPLHWARLAVIRCEHAGWNEPPPPLLVRFMQEVAVANPHLSGVIRRLTDRPPLLDEPDGADPLDALWLPAVGLPFVNRRRLREVLRHMSTPDGPATGSPPPAVLVVTGAEGGGKSYTVDLLEHCLRHRRAELAVHAPDVPPPRVGLVSVTRDFGPSTTPDWLVRRLAEVMLNPITEPLPAHGPADKRNEHLCRLVMNLATRSASEWWLVIDRLHEPDLSPQTHGFVRKLAEHVARRTERPAVRLILIGSRPDAVGTDRVEHEDIGPIGEVDLEPFYTRLLTRTTGQPAPPAAVRVAVGMALSRLPAGRDRLTQLNALLRASVAELGHA